MTKKTREKLVKIFAVLAIAGMIISLLGGSILYLVAL